MHISVLAATLQSGLLLGVETESPSPYRTLWIAPQHGVVRLLANGPDLLVPRQDGFWRVCVVGGYELDQGRLTEWDSVFAARAEPRRQRCAAPVAGPTESEQQQANCHEVSRSRIRFLGTDAVSIEEHIGTNCGAHYSEGTTAALRALDDWRAMDIESRLPPRQRRELFGAAMAAAGAEFEDVGTIDTGAATEDDSVIVPRLQLLHEWGIERGEGQWRAIGHADCSPYVACGAGSRTFSVPAFRLPTAIVGHDSLAVDLATIRRALPRVNDAVSSPRGDLIVALSDDSLFAFTPRGGTLGQPVLRLQINARIVMAQWALGRFVPRWTAQLRPLLGSH